MDFRASIDGLATACGKRLAADLPSAARRSPFRQPRPAWQFNVPRLRRAAVGFWGSATWVRPVVEGNIQSEGRTAYLQIEHAGTPAAREQRLTGHLRVLLTVRFGRLNLGLANHRGPKSAMAQNVDEIIDKMQQFKQHGVMFCLTTSGPAIRSLEPSKRLLLDQLKIGRPRSCAT